MKHEEEKLFILRYDLPALLGRDEENGSKWDYLGYLV
jgi:hypothetical protein